MAVSSGTLPLRPADCLAGADGALSFRASMTCTEGAFHPQQPFPKRLCSPGLYVSLKKEKMYPKSACRISECLWELRKGRCLLKSQRFTLHLVCDPSHKTSSSTPQFLPYEMSVIESNLQVLYVD